MCKTSLREKYLGPITGVYVDTFGVEYHIFDKSKLYYIQNVGQHRKVILDYLDMYYKDSVIVIEPNSIFKYIEIAVTKPEVYKDLFSYLHHIKCYLVREDGC